MLDRASGPRQGHGEQGTELRVECLALEGNRIWGKKGGVCEVLGASSLDVWKDRLVPLACNQESQGDK